LNFFQFKAYLHARVPRVRCPDCGVHTVTVPWIRKGSGFTLLFEKMCMDLVCVMPVKTIAKLIELHDTRLWRLVKYHVEAARANLDFSSVTSIGIDETSCKKGHDYITLFVDLKNSSLLFSTKGKGSDTINTFLKDFKEHGGNPDKVENFCCDMSPAFIRGIKDNFPMAQITFDKFHLIQTVNKAVDEVRREERKSQPELLKRTRFLWLKNPQNLTQKQSRKLQEISLNKLNLKTVRAYHIKLAFQDIFNMPADIALGALKKWYFWATHSRLQPMIQAARAIKNHWNGVLRWFESRINNGILEGLNSLIQAAKNKARGYRNSDNMITVSYLIAGKLQFKFDN
jgi:transposase